MTNITSLGGLSKNNPTVQFKGGQRLCPPTFDWPSTENVRINPILINPQMSSKRCRSSHSIKRSGISGILSPALLTSKVLNSLMSSTSQPSLNWVFSINPPGNTTNKSSQLMMGESIATLPSRPNLDEALI